MEKTITFSPKNIPVYSASFLSEEQQKAYEEAAEVFRNERTQDNLSVPINGSNLFKVILLNQIGIRTATLADLDSIVQKDSDFLRRTYEDAPSVVLRSNGDSNKQNDYLAKSLAKLVKVKRFSGMPIVINGLELVQDNSSAYGLNFKAGKNFNFFNAPELAYSNNQKRFSKQDERGMPIFDEKGTRILYTKQEGLSGLYLNGYLDLNSDYGDLAGSYDDGRVVFLK